MNPIRWIEERYVPRPEHDRKVWMWTLVAGIVIAILVALLILGTGADKAHAATLQSPTGGTQYPSTGGTEAPPHKGGIGSAVIFDSVPFRLYGVHGRFTMAQGGRYVHFRVSGRGATTQDITQLRYKLTLSRKPLHATKGTQWKVYRKRHFLEGFEGGATGLHFHYGNWWKLPKGKRTYRYLLKAKLSFTANATPTNKGHTKSRWFVRELLPV